MILVLLGTNPYPFHRLMSAVINWAEGHDEKVIVQSGNTPVNTKVIEFYDFVDHAKILDWINQETKL